MTLESARAAPRAARTPRGPTHVATGRARPRRSPAVVEISDRRVFLTQPAPAEALAVPHPAPARQGGRARPRVRGGVPGPRLYLDGPGTTPGSPTDGATFLLSARRRKKNDLLELRHLAGRGGPERGDTVAPFFGKLRESSATRRARAITVFDKGARPRRDRAERRPQDAAPSFAPGGKRRPAGTLRRPELNSARFGTNTTCWARRARGS